MLCAACDAFWGQCRLGELLCTSPNNFHPSQHPTTDALSFQMDGAVLQLPWTKVKRSQGDTVALTSQLLPLDPASAHKYHHSVNGPQPGAHLYSYTTPAGHRPL